MKRPVLALALLLVAAATPALAHDLPGPSTFAAGLGHPLLGLDHLLAMTAIGLWSSIAGGRALWAWPASFIVMMLGGFVLGVLGVALPLVEPAILASVVVLGFLVAAMARPSLATGVALVALFALFHGHAHGAEAPSGDVVGYAAGFVLATAGLHVLGIAFASGLAAARRPAFIRMMGRGIALVGIVLA